MTHWPVVTNTAVHVAFNTVAGRRRLKRATRDVEVFIPTLAPALLEREEEGRRLGVVGVLEQL